MYKISVSYHGTQQGSLFDSISSFTNDPDGMIYIYNSKSKLTGMINTKYVEYILIGEYEENENVGKLPEAA